jgi:beta-glucanase (GH16 family)
MKPPRLRLTAILATTAMATAGVITAPTATAATLPLVDDFEAALPAGNDPNGIPVGFYQATDPNSSTTFQRTTSPPAPVPGSAADNNVLGMDFTVQSFGVVVNAFTDPAATQWLTQDWSPYEGVQFWLYGSGNNTDLFIDVIDNRPVGSQQDNAERFSVGFKDTTAGWRLVQIPFDDLNRKDIGNGAPNDGLGLTEIHGWAFGTLATSGTQTYYIDDVSVYGVAPIRPATLGFGTTQTTVTEGQTASIPVKLSKAAETDVTARVRTTHTTAERGVDFEDVSTTVTIPAGQTIVNVDVPTTDNSTYQGERAVVLELDQVTGVDRGRPPVTRLLIQDDETPDPNLVDGFESEPELWTEPRNNTVERLVLNEGDRLARPGQEGRQSALSVTARGAKMSVERDFPIEQDWSSSDALSFWYYGRNTRKPVDIELVNPTRSATEGDPSSWRLVWADEFNGKRGTGPDPEIWTPELGDGTINGIPGWGNDELQYYTDSRDNAAMDGRGNLVITTRAVDQSDPAKAPICYYGACAYTSARLITQEKAEFAYGRIEARAKVPGGAGLWPAFWSLGTNIPTTPWPQAGEIDIMEFVGRNPTEIFGTIHGPGYSGGQSFGRSYDFGTPVPDDYHTYRVDWYEDRIVWAVDDIEYHEAIPADVDPNEWVFNHPFFLLLNVAVGGNFGGAVSPDTQFPAETKVDYVRVYQADRKPVSHTTRFVDDFSGWRQVTVPFEQFGAGLDTSSVIGLRLSTQVRPKTPVLIDELRLVCADTLTVTSAADSGEGSLRAATNAVCAGGTVEIDPALAGETVQLQSPLTLTKEVTIDGSGAPGLTLDGGGDSRVVEVAGGTSATITDLTLTNGYGYELAGGVLNNGDLTLERVTVTGNRVTTGGIDFWKGGGGIYSGENASLRLVDSTVSANTVEGGAGGGIYSFFNSTTTIERSTISGNTVNDVGGGLRLLGDATIRNSTISGNTSTGWHGGGLFVTDASSTFEHVTIANNTSPGGTAGGMFVGTFGAPVDVTWSSSVVAGNSGDQCVVFGGGAAVLTSTGGNVVADASCGAAVGNDQHGVDALLEPLADNGGPTLTHQLGAGSPAVDAATGSTQSVDQRGVSRPAGAARDAGAVEAR